MCIECFDLDFKVGEVIVDTEKFKWDMSRARASPGALHLIRVSEAASFVCVCVVLSAWLQTLNSGSCCQSGCQFLRTLTQSILNT